MEKNRVRLRKESPDTVCRKNSGRMEDKEIELNTEIQPDFHYEGDGRLIEKVFSNVISNAAAYSPAGAVITVSLQNGVFTVENSGAHIAEKDLKQIFTPCEDYEYCVLIQILTLGEYQIDLPLSYYRTGTSTCSPQNTHNIKSTNKI